MPGSMARPSNASQQHFLWCDHFIGFVRSFEIGLGIRWLFVRAGRSADGRALPGLGRFDMPDDDTRMVFQDGPGEIFQRRSRIIGDGAEVIEQGHQRN